MAGLTTEGLVVPTMQEIREQLEGELRSVFGTSIRLGDDSVFGQIVAIFSESIATVWELAEALYDALDPDRATGAALHATGALTGTTPLAPASSTVTATLTGTPGTEVLTASRASVEGTGALFQTLADATLVSATAWGATTGYTVGQVRTNAARIYLCITAGTSAGSGGPTTTSDDITDGSVHWRYLGEGTGYVDVAMSSVDFGPIVALSGDLNEIETPVSGWDSVINVLDADLGRLQESDEAFRIRRTLELSRAGEATLDAIRAELLEVTDVTAVTVFHNNTDATDGDGVPPHSVEALVQGGDDQAIWDQLLASAGAGIRTYGGETGTSEDSAGNSHDMAFSRPTLVPIYVIVTLTKDADLYPADGDAQIEDAIVAYGDAQKTGRDAVPSALVAQCFSVPGVLNVSALTIGIAPAPVGTTAIAIALRELATYDTSRITVNSSNGTP